MRNFKEKIEEDVLFQKKILRQDMMRLHKTEEEYLTVSNGRFYRNSYLGGKRISKYISADEKRLLGYLLRRGLYKIGLLSDAEYRKKWSDKQLFYFLQGINQGDRLIVTCDDAEGRFDSSIAASIIEKLAREQGDVLY